MKDSKKVFEVPAEGSLGLLALGHVGLEAWRKKRKEVNGEPGPSVTGHRPQKEDSGQ